MTDKQKYREFINDLHELTNYEIMYCIANDIVDDGNYALLGDEDLRELFVNRDLRESRSTRTSNSIPPFGYFAQQQCYQLKTSMKHANSKC